MILEIDLSSNEPIYRQIHGQVVHAVASGELSPGDRLPSVRSLASDLGVNMHTVNKAYAMLRDEGYVCMRGRSGAIVADASTASSPARAREAQNRIEEGLRRLAIEFRARGGSLNEFTELAKAQAEAAYDQKEADVR